MQPGAFVQGQWCTGMVQSGGNGDLEMLLEGAELEMSSADGS